MASSGPHDRDPQPTADEENPADGSRPSHGAPFTLHHTPPAPPPWAFAAGPVPEGPGGAHPEPAPERVGESEETARPAGDGSSGPAPGPEHPATPYGEAGPGETARPGDPLSAGIRPDGRPRRLTDRPDVLVAIGPPRRPRAGSTGADPGPPRAGSQEDAGGTRAAQGTAAPPLPVRRPARLPAVPGRPPAAAARAHGRGLLRRPVVLAVVAALCLAAGALGLLALRSGTADGGWLTGGEGLVADAAFPARGGRSHVLNAVAAAGSMIVAAGSDTTGPRPRPLFLVSPDEGETWEAGRTLGPAAGAAGAVGRVASGGGRWLAVGTDATGRAGHAMWTSADGRSWTPVDPARLAAFAPGDRVSDLAGGEQGFAAAGVTTRPDGTPGPVVWLSPDGERWTRVDDRGGLPGRIGGIAAIAMRGDRVVALADAGGSASVVLRSDDGGRTWRAGESPLPGVRAEPGALAATERGFVLVPVRQRTADGRVPVYCSPDGGRWTGCGAIGGLGPDGPGVRAVGASEAGVAALVETEWGRYTAYTSADGGAWTRAAELGEIPGTLRGLTITGAGLLVAGGDRRGRGDVENLPVLVTARAGGSVTAVPPERIAGLRRDAGEVADLAAAGGTFVAVGSADGDAAIWTARDGAGWAAAGPAGPLSGPGRQELTGVAHGPEGWLAVGSTTPEPALTRPLLVTSADGRTWRPGPEIEAPADHPALAPVAVAAGPQGYVIAGEDHGPDGARPALWFSADLTRFARIPAESLPDEGAGVRLAGVTATPDGFAAVGSAGRDGRETGIVWRSADGRAWTAAARVLPPGARSAALHRVVSVRSALVVLGTAATGDGARPFSAVSTDGGATWRYGRPPAEETAAVLDVAVTARGLVAVGADGAAGAGDGTVWLSADGLAWTRHPLTAEPLGGPGDQWLGLVAASGDRVVGVGGSADEDGEHVIVWRTTVAAAGG